MPDLFDQTNPPVTVRLHRACQCGSHEFRIEPGQGPHLAGLRCSNCGIHAGWLPRETYEAYRKAGRL